jgi:hypothetical protein
MKCEEVIELMQRDLDGDLNVGEKNELSYHLSSCYDCQALFDRLKNVSFRLEALPKVTPAYSIVDKVLPVLDQIDLNSVQNVSDVQQKSPLKNSQGKYRGFKKNKRLWIPGIATAAVLLISFVIMDQSARFDMDLLSSSSQEEAYDTSPQDSGMIESSNDTAGITGDEGAPDEDPQMSSTGLAPENNNEAKDQYGTEDSAPEARTFEAPVEDNDTMKEETAMGGLPQEESVEDEATLSKQPENNKVDGSERGEENQESMTIYETTAEDEATKYVSPDEVYTAHEGLGGGDILFQKENRAYYITKNTWEEPWEVELIEWVSNHELYYELYHPVKDERQYWIVDADERTEEQLEEPYHSQENDQ